MTQRYTPRRANLKRWLEGAPEYVLDVFDNKGKTADRYTVLFTDTLLNHPKGETPTRANAWIDYLGMSDAPTHPQGVSMWGSLSVPDAAAYRFANGRERIRWLDLPAHIRAHVIARATKDD